MGLRIIQPNGTITELQPFVKKQEFSVQLWCNAQTHEHNLKFARMRKRVLRKSDNHFTIEFSVDVFRLLVKSATSALRAFVQKTKSNRAFDFSSVPMAMDAEMHRCIYRMTHYSGEEELKTLYLHAQALELLMRQHENYLRATTLRPVYIKNEYDKERVLYARDYLLTHMDAPPTLPQLAAIVGINEFKLKRGFKEMFNHTVFGYLADVRLEMARTALQQKQKTITQIAFELGYASPQHFSGAFKKKFGVAPVRYV